MAACGPLLRRRRRATRRHRRASCRLLLQQRKAGTGTIDTGAFNEEAVGFKQGRKQAELWNDLWSDVDPYGEALEAKKERERIELGLQQLADEDSQGLLQKKRIMLLIADTGGGHRASARAVADALEELFPDQVSISIRDIWTECCPWPFNKVVQSYMWMAKKPWFWRIFFLTSTFPITRWFSQRFANVRCKRAFRHEIEIENPDLIISLHPCTQHITMKVLRRLARRTRRRIPFVTVVTDLGGAHPMWFHPDADKVFVPSEDLRNEALRCGVRESSIHMYGLPLRRDFWNPEPRSRAAVREALGLAQEPRTVLVIGGGDGVGRLQQVALATGRELAATFGEEASQLVVICGKNERVKRNLSAASWPGGLHVHVLGFVANVHEWMSAADVIVTKAGPGTIAEACTRQLPVMLSSFLPCQEHGNVGFVVNGGFGAYTPKAEEIAKTVCGWFKDPEELARMSHQSAKQSRPNATRKIAEVIGRKWVRTASEELKSALQRELHAGGGGGGGSGGAAPIEDALQQLMDATDKMKEAQLALREAKAVGLSTLERALARPAQTQDA